MSLLSNKNIFTGSYLQGILNWNSQNLLEDKEDKPYLIQVFNLHQKAPHILYIPACTPGDADPIVGIQHPYTPPVQVHLLQYINERSSLSTHSDLVNLKLIS